NEDRGIDEARHADDGVRWSNLREHFPMRAARLLPPRGILEIDTRPHDVLEGRTRLVERRTDDPEGLAGLSFHITGREDLATCPRRRRSRHLHDIPDPHRTRVPHDPLPRPIGGNTSPFHGIDISAGLSSQPQGPERGKTLPFRATTAEPDPPGIAFHRDGTTASRRRPRAGSAIRTRAPACDGTSRSGRGC